MFVHLYLFVPISAYNYFYMIEIIRAVRSIIPATGPTFVSFHMYLYSKTIIDFWSETSFNVVRCGVFTPNWQFFNAYKRGKNSTWRCDGILAIFDLAAWWKCGIYHIKTLTRRATVEWLMYEGKFSPIRDCVFLCTFKKL